MDRRTVYIDLDYATVVCTAEGIEMTADDAVVVVSGGAEGFNRLITEIAVWGSPEAEEMLL